MKQDSDLPVWLSALCATLRVLLLRLLPLLRLHLRLLLLLLRLRLRLLRYLLKLRLKVLHSSPDVRKMHCALPCLLPTCSQQMPKRHPDTCLR